MNETSHADWIPEKVAIVTGSAKRLGRAIALGLAGKGYFCWVQYQHSHAEALETLNLIHLQGGKGHLIQGNQDNRENHCLRHRHCNRPTGLLRHPNRR